MKHRASAIRIALAIVSVAALAASMRLASRAAAIERECASCAEVAESLAPYVGAVRGYANARDAFADAAPAIPAPRLGLPAVSRDVVRGPVAIDGWVPVRVTYSWQSIGTGQAFAALDSFTAEGFWTVTALRLEAMDAGTASLSVTLEGAERAESGE